MQRNVVSTSEFHCPKVQNLCSMCGKFECFFLADGAHAPRGRHNARVSSEQPVNVGVDFAHVGVQSGSQGDRCRIGAAATQRRRFVIF